MMVGISPFDVTDFSDSERTESKLISSKSGTFLSSMTVTLVSGLYSVISISASLSVSS